MMSGNKVYAVSERYNIFLSVSDKATPSLAASATIREMRNSFASRVVANICIAR